MRPEITEIWVYLSQSPLLWLTVTLVAYVGAERLSVRFKRHPLANPVIVAATLLVGLLVVTRTPYGAYFDGAQFVHFLLAPPPWRWRCRSIAISGPCAGRCCRWRPPCWPDR
jgi:hypothetical protein